MFIALLKTLGGIAVFLFGLKTISDGTKSFVEAKNTEQFAKFASSPLGGAMLGTAVAGVTQSSVAVSFITVGLVEAGVLTFRASAPIIMGANVGTTVTAQLISLSGGSGAIIGSIASIIGLLTGFCKNKGVKSIGASAMGLGLIFAGLQIMDGAIFELVKYGWFKMLFMTNSSILLFLNGAIMTAIIQSSSAVTGITVILANNGHLAFNSAVFLTLGSNVGSCFSVIIASLNKSLEARRASVFNLCFNFLGALIFFPIMTFADKAVTQLFSPDAIGVGRAIANFHTIFNLSCALVFLPFTKYLTDFISKIVSSDEKAVKSKVFYKTFTR